MKRTVGDRQETVFTDIITLSFDQGHCQLSIDDSGLLNFGGDADANHKVVKTGNTLTISGAGGGGGGGTIVMNGMVINGIGGGGSYSIINGRRIEFRNKGKDLYVDGHKMVRADQAQALALAAPEPKLDIPTYRLGQGCSISNITIRGSSDLKSISPIFLSPASMNLMLTGSGDINLPSTMVFETLVIQLSGSGDISCSDEGRVQAKMLSVSLAGSGDIKRIHVLNTGNLSLAGSGDISVTKEPGATVNKQKAGSGSISVK